MPTVARAILTNNITGVEAENPLTETVAHVDRSRIIILANSDVSWSYDLCVYYCKKRGIPVENIMSFSFGTDSYATVAGDDYRTVYDPVKARVKAIHATGVIAGPGVQTFVRAPIYSYNGATYTFSGQYGYPCTYSILADCLIQESWSHDVAGTILNSSDPTGNGWLWRWRYVDPHYNYFANSKMKTEWPQYVSSPYESWQDYYPQHAWSSHSNSSYYYIATKHAVDMTFQAAAPKALISGKIGTGASWSQIGQPIANRYKDDYDTCKRIIDKALYWEKFHNLESAKQEKVLVHINSVGGSPPTFGWWVDDMYAVVSYLLNIGLKNTKYYYSDDSNATVRSVTYTNIKDGPFLTNENQVIGPDKSIFGTKFFAQLGDLHNDGIVNNSTGPITNDRNKIFIGEKGSCSMLLASYGHSWGLETLLNSEDAVSALTNVWHIGGGMCPDHFSYFYNLLRGMTCAEAALMTEQFLNGIYAVGDPLYTPYPHRKRAIGDKTPTSKLRN